MQEDFLMNCDASKTDFQVSTLWLDGHVLWLWGTLSGTVGKLFINPETKPVHWCINPRPLTPGFGRGGGEKGSCCMASGKAFGGDVTLTSYLRQNANAQTVGEQERSKVHAGEPSRSQTAQICAAALYGQEEHTDSLAKIFYLNWSGDEASDGENSWGSTWRRWSTQFWVSKDKICDEGVYVSLKAHVIKSVRKKRSWNS